MEIALLSENSLRIKSKRVTFVVDQSIDKLQGKQVKSGVNGIIVLTQSQDLLPIQTDAVIIDGPGEYEIGGVKMNAASRDRDIIYNLNVDGAEVLLGKITALEKMQHKLKEQHIVVAYSDAMTTASFITSIASNVVIFYGDRAKELAGSFGRADVKTVGKYSVSYDKLPQEVETVVLE